MVPIESFLELKKLLINFLNIALLKSIFSRETFHFFIQKSLKAFNLKEMKSFFFTHSTQKKKIFTNFLTFEACEKLFINFSNTESFQETEKLFINSTESESFKHS